MDLLSGLALPTYNYGRVMLHEAISGSFIFIRVSIGVIGGPSAPVIAMTLMYLFYHPPQQDTL